jgi:hypothetical protein
VEYTDIKYIDFREGTGIDIFTILLNHDQKVQWDQIFLPQIIQKLHIEGQFHKPFYVYQGNELEYINYPEQVQELTLNNLDIQQLHLSSFINLETLNFESCNFFNHDKLIIPQDIKVKISNLDGTLSKNWFDINVTYLILHFTYFQSVSRCSLQYPKTLKVFELYFGNNTLFQIRNWYQHFTVENLPYLNAFCFMLTFAYNPLWELKQLLQSGKLNLKAFFNLRELNIRKSFNTRFKADYDLYMFVKDVEDKLPISLQEIRFTEDYPRRDNPSYQTAQISRDQQWIIEHHIGEETESKMRDRLYSKYY